MDLLTLSVAPELTLSQAAAAAFPEPDGFVTISPHTRRWLSSSTNQLISFIGDAPLTAVTPPNIRAWQLFNVERGLTAVTNNSYLRAVKLLYTRLQRNRITGHNPAANVPYLPEPKPGPKAITHDNYLKLVAAADTARNRAIVSVFWSTGARLAGVCGMDITADRMDHWKDANGRSCYAFLVVEKGNKSRWVYVKGDAALSLNAWLVTRPTTPCPALFVSERAPHRLTITGMSHVLRKIRIEAGNPPNANAHAFRHAFAIRKLDQGYDLALVSQWLGHSTPEFTAKVYAVRRESELRRAFFKNPKTN